MHGAVPKDERDVLTNEWSTGKVGKPRIIIGGTCLELTDTQ